jgi:hypothetical protein
MYGFDGESILRILEKNAGLSWLELCRAVTGFGTYPEAHYPNAVMPLYDCLADLNDLGFISVDGVLESQISEFLTLVLISPEGITDANEAKTRELKTSLDARKSAKIRASRKWHSVDMVLKVPGRYGGELMFITPFFGRPRIYSPSDIFVLMPFSEEMRAVYTDHIKRITASLKLTVARADDFFTSNTIMSDIWRGICGASLVIADCTGRNPNVFYELGIAHTVGKSVILLTQKKDDVPSDLRNVRYIKYEPTESGMKLFDEHLNRAITESLKLPD